MTTHAGNVEFVQEVSLSVSPEAVWNALTKPEQVRAYHLAPLYRIELKVGGDILYGTDEKVLISGTIMECLENSRLVHTFRFGPESGSGTCEDGDTVVRYEIREEGGATILRVTHTGFKEENPTYANIVGGWPFIFGQLKVFLESESCTESRR